MQKKNKHKWNDEMKVVEYAKGIRIFVEIFSVYFVYLNYIPWMSVVFHRLFYQKKRKNSSAECEILLERNHYISLKSIETICQNRKRFFFSLEICKILNIYPFFLWLRVFSSCTDSLFFSYIDTRKFKILNSNLYWHLPATSATDCYDSSPECVFLFCLLLCLYLFLFRKLVPYFGITKVWCIKARQLKITITQKQQQQKILKRINGTNQEKKWLSDNMKVFSFVCYLFKLFIRILDSCHFFFHLSLNPKIFFLPLLYFFHIVLF